MSVQSGHSIGKTFSVAGIVIWFLNCFEPCIVVTTSPSTDQVNRQVWGEIRKQARSAKEPLMQGLYPAKPRWQISPMWYAMGLSTDKQERFRGDHSPNMLFVFDEANGIPPWAWEEAENMCTQPGNKILAIANPTTQTGPYFDTFKEQSGWYNIQISSLDHPNVVEGRTIFPGAASRQWVDGRIKKLCTPISAKDVDPKTDFEFPKCSGKWYHPSGVFEARVMGRFASDDPDTLIPFSTVVYARTNHIPLDATAAIDIGADIARKGTDTCTLFARQGPCVIKRLKWQGRDIAQSTGKIARYLKDLTHSGYTVGTVAIDAIGLGAGVADNLRDMKDQGEIQAQNILAVQVSERANDPEHYDTKRTELAFALAERFKQNLVDLTRLGEDAADFEAQAPQVKWDYTRLGRYIVESKEKYRDRQGYSPDDFDALELCFIDTVDSFAEDYADLICG